MKYHPDCKSGDIIGEDNRAGRPFRGFSEVQERGGSDWDKERVSWCQTHAFEKSREAEVVIECGVMKSLSDGSRFLSRATTEPEM